MNNFARRLITEWRKLDLPFTGKTFVAAVSGGADSVSLLLSLEELKTGKKLNNRFVAAHFNHNLRGDESEKDAEFVKTLCEKFDFELAVGDGNVSSKGNLEQNARIARYEFLKNTAENFHADGVLTAHTVNDQAETFLINLLRGSGIAGLSAMKTIRFLENSEAFEDGVNPTLLIRPLLNWAKRSDTENYCHLREIEPRFDSMNEDLNFKRVRIRKILLPLMKEFNPKIVETLAKTSQLLRLEKEKNDETNELKKDPKIEFKALDLALTDLRNVSKSILYDTLRNWLKFNIGGLRGLELKHLEAIERLIFSRKSGKVVELPNSAAIVKESGRILFKNFKVEK